MEVSPGSSLWLFKEKGSGAEPREKETEKGRLVEHQQMLSDYCDEAEMGLKWYRTGTEVVQDWD